VRRLPAAASRSTEGLSVFAVRIRILMFVLGVAALCVPAAAQESGISAGLHPWGRFVPGSWNLVRVVTEMVDEQGQVTGTSTRDTKTTLLSVEADGVTLEVETCKEVAGKRFPSEPQTDRQGFHGETLGSSPKSKEPVDGELTIEDRKIPCKVQELSVDGQKGKMTVTLYYSTKVFPYILKQVSAVVDADGKTSVSETDMDVIALDMPTRFRNETLVGAYIRTVHKTAKATVTTISVVAPEVPGSVVSQSSKEVGTNGQPVRRTTIELLDYNANPEKDRRGLFNRKRPPRRTKQPPTR
jgi:hypothetical protein